MYTVEIASVLSAWLLIYLPRMVVARIQMQQPGGLDNQHPRSQQANLSGLGARAQGAHLNGFESFPPFAVGVVICSMRHVDSTFLAAACVSFVAIRVVYTLLYLMNQPTARSIAWGMGALTTLALFVAALGFGQA